MLLAIYTTQIKKSVQKRFSKKKIIKKGFEKFVSRGFESIRTGAHLDELQHGGTETETSVTEFCYKSVNLFFKKLINIKVILFLIHEPFR